MKEPLVDTTVAQNINSCGLKFRNSKTYTVCHYISKIFHREIISVFIAEGQPWRCGYSCDTTGDNKTRIVSSGNRKILSEDKT